MTHKQVLFRSAAREKILRGATQLAEAIRITLGPCSKSVLIQKKWGTPLVCNDGVTIAKEVALLDPDENLGAQVLREAAERTGELVGDGTTTSTLLAHSMLAEGMNDSLGVGEPAEGAETKAPSGSPLPPSSQAATTSHS